MGRGCCIDGVGRGCGREGVDMSCGRDEVGIGCDREGVGINCGRDGVVREGIVNTMDETGVDTDGGCAAKFSLLDRVLVDMFKVSAVDCVTLCLPTAMPTGMECPELVRVLGTSSKIVFG